MREKPLVVILTDGFLQANRGEDITARQRREETKKAMDLLGCSVIFAGIRDDSIIEPQVYAYLSTFHGFETVYAPEPNSSNLQHNTVGEIAKKLFPKVVTYPTYNKEQLYMTGTKEIIPTKEEQELKNRALKCYESQLNLPATAPHFWAVAGKSEWHIEN